jgi:glycerate 2-kinase
MLALTAGLTADDLVLCLISGGGSSLLTLPADGLTLADKQRINRALLESGASIGEMNCVRKHLSRIKGGRLAAACAPARVVTLAISDVPGDDPSVIASGPTVPDATTCADALEILARYRIDVPPPVRQALQSGALETPKPGDGAFAGHRCTWSPHPGRRWRRQRPWRAGRGWRPTSCPTRSKANPARWACARGTGARRGVARPAV